MIIIVQNDPEVPAGNFMETIAERGVSPRIIHAYAGESIPRVRDVTAAMVLGGAMGVNDLEAYPFLEDVRAFIRSCVDRELPFLGICLGGQLLADVLEGRVISGSPHGEKGTLPVTLTAEGENDPLFEGIPREFFTFQWHNDSFEVPEGGTLLASSAACPSQAFRFGACAWGTQFHPEVTRAIVDSWARWSDETAQQADRFLSSFAAVERSYLEVSRRILGNFLSFSRSWR